MNGLNQVSNWKSLNCLQLISVGSISYSICCIQLVVIWRNSEGFDIVGRKQDESWKIWFYSELKRWWKKFNQAGVLLGYFTVCCWTNLMLIGWRSFNWTKWDWYFQCGIIWTRLCSMWLREGQHLLFLIYNIFD